MVPDNRRLKAARMRGRYADDMRLGNADLHVRLAHRLRVADLPRHRIAAEQLAVAPSPDPPQGWREQFARLRWHWIGLTGC